MSKEGKARFTEEMKLWLFDLWHGNLSDEQIVQGFIKHYILYDLSISDVKRDIVYHTLCSATGIKEAEENITRVMRILAGEEDAK